MVKALDEYEKGGIQMKSEDIAKIAGVSRSTVSRVINNYSNVPEETREKVMKIVREYHYMPNTFARTLAGKKSNTIGLFFVITGETFQNSRIARNDYFSSYLNFLVDIANGMDYYVLVNTIRIESEYEKVNQAFMEKRIDGGILIGTQDDTLSKMHLNTIKAPMVIFDYDVKNLHEQGYKSNDITLVNSMDKSGIEKAVVYLKNKGHVNIGFIKGNLHTRSGRVRYQGFIDVMSEHGLEVNEKYVIEGEFSAKAAYKGIKEAIARKQLPSAYISSNDFMALEAMKVLQEEGYKVPEDIAMIGFDNVHMTEQSHPPMTSLEPRFYDMARKAVELLDNKLHNPEILTQDVYDFGVDIIVRDSC